MFENFVLQKDIDEMITRLESELEQLKNKTVLLTGSCGFLGRYFCSMIEKVNLTKFQDTPIKLYAIDNLMLSKDLVVKPKENSSIEFMNADVIDGTSGLDMPIDYIIHAAGVASPHYYRKYPLETLDVEVNGTRNLLELTKHNPGCRFFKFSSSEIYGDPDPRFVPIKEEYRGNVSSMGPRACYDEGKRLSETLCYIYSNNFNVHTNIVRPFNVYGPGMQELDYRVMPNFASRIKADSALQIYGQGNQTRTFTYITDAMVGFTKVLVNGEMGEAYNIGNPTPEVSMLDLVKHIETALDKSVKYETVVYPDSYPDDEPRRRCPDISKASESLNFKPTVDLVEGLKRFLGWADIHYKGIQS